MRKASVTAIGFAVALFLAGSAVGALASRAAGPFAWFQGDDQSYVGRPQATGELSVFAKTDVNVLANHIRLAANDGNFELEHGGGREASHLIAYDFSGDGNTRTPIVIGGGDSQDIVSLIVDGKRNQTHDLQQWATAGAVKVAVDGRGRLRVGQITLTTQLVKGKAQLVAVLPGGARQVLASAR